MTKLAYLYCVQGGNWGKLSDARKNLITTVGSSKWHQYILQLDVIMERGALDQAGAPPQRYSRLGFAQDFILCVPRRTEPLPEREEGRRKRRKFPGWRISTYAYARPGCWIYSTVQLQAPSVDCFEVWNIYYSSLVLDKRTALKKDRLGKWTELLLAERFQL